MRIIVFLTGIVMLFAACEEAVEVPKPRAYPKVVFPEKAYQPFDKNYCSFTFEQPAYATIEQDTSFFGERPKDDCWFNINVPSLGAKIHCSYYSIGNRAHFDKLVEDAYVMAQKHNIKASYIEELEISRPAKKVYGTVFNIDGPVASTYQFYLTDSTRNFLRGALYITAPPRPDSLAPVLEFMRADVNKLVETLEWRK